jgi:hypothetical protein
MKKIVITAILTLTLWGVAKAQHRHHERLRAYKTAYITQELEMTSAEAEKFWPVYNAFEEDIYENKVLKLRKQGKEIEEKGGPDALSEKEAGEILDGLLKNEKEVLESREKLYRELSSILPKVKLLKLYKAEKDFNKHLLSEYRRNKPGSEVKEKP